MTAQQPRQTPMTALTAATLLGVAFTLNGPVSPAAAESTDHGPASSAADPAQVRVSITGSKAVPGHRLEGRWESGPENAHVRAVMGDRTLEAIITGERSWAVQIPEDSPDGTLTIELLDAQQSVVATATTRVTGDPLHLAGLPDAVETSGRITGRVTGTVLGSNLVVTTTDSAGTRRDSTTAAQSDTTEFALETDDMPLGWVVVTAAHLNRGQAIGRVFVHAHDYHPALAVEGSQAVQGGSIALRLTGWNPGQPVTVQIGSQATTVTADSEGSWQGRVPIGVPAPGTQEVTATDGYSHAEQEITVSDHQEKLTGPDRATAGELVKLTASALLTGTRYRVQIIPPGGQPSTIREFVATGESTPITFPLPESDGSYGFALLDPHGGRASMSVHVRPAPVHQPEAAPIEETEAPPSSAETDVVSPFLVPTAPEATTPVETPPTAVPLSAPVSAEAVPATAAAKKLPEKPIEVKEKAGSDPTLSVPAELDIQTQAPSVPVPIAPEAVVAEKAGSDPTPAPRRALPKPSAPGAVTTPSRTPSESTVSAHRQSEAAEKEESARPWWARWVAGIFALFSLTSGALWWILVGERRREDRKGQ